MQTLLDANARPDAGEPRSADRAFIVTAEGLAAPVARRDGPACANQIHRILGLRDPVVEARLATAIQRAICDGCTGLVLWRRPVGGAVLLVVRQARSPGAAVVRIDPLEPDSVRLQASTLAQLFGLSRSESEIAAALAADLSLAEIAAMRGVGLETVRGQVKSLLRKMELNSQKQLMRVLTRIDVALA